VQSCDVKMAHFPALDARILSCIDNPSLTLLPWQWTEALIVSRRREGFVACETECGVSFAVIPNDTVHIVCRHKSIKMLIFVQKEVEREFF